MTGRQATFLDLEGTDHTNTESSELEANDFAKEATTWVVFLMPQMGSYLVLEHELRDAGAIVLLLGSTPERELEVADLYRQGLAPQVIMAEFRVHNHELIDEHRLNIPRGIDNTLSVLEQLGVPADVIRIIPGEVSSTRGEARAVSQYLQHIPHRHGERITNACAYTLRHGERSAVETQSHVSSKLCVYRLENKCVSYNEIFSHFPYL